MSTHYYVLPDLETLTNLTGIVADQEAYNGASIFHKSPLGLNPTRQIGEDEEGNPIVQVSEGYHLNSAAEIPALSAYKVTPDNPITFF